MRSFLPIKGPGGRYLTTREKIALLILGITLALCLLTLFAGDRAYESGQEFNPISAFAAWLARTFGGGIIALYALVVVWSGLIYFKGESAVRVGPLPGRLFAALCVTIGVSGLLGIPGLVTAGALGSTVGSAVGNTFGAPLGFPVLILLLMLGAHLAGQGALAAIREPVAVAAQGSAASGLGAPGASGLGAGGLGFSAGGGTGRFPTEAPLPDDGDPSADERSFAVTQAMEEIERSKGVTIVDIDPGSEDGGAEDGGAEPADADPETGLDRTSIGEEVEAAPAPAENTEEAEVRRGLAEVADALSAPAVIPPPPEPSEAPAGDTAPRAPSDDECIDVEEFRQRDGDDDAEEASSAARQGAATESDGTAVQEPATAEYDEETYAHDDDETDEFEPPADESSETSEDGQAEDEEEEAEYEEEEEYDDEEEAEYEEEEYEEADSDEEDGDEEAEYEEDEEDEDGDEAEYEEYEEDEAELEADGDDDDAEFDDEEDIAAEKPAAERTQAAIETEPDDEPVAAAGDPYARGGLLRRVTAERDSGKSAQDGEDLPFTAFDWRGRPLE